MTALEKRLLALANGKELPWNKTLNYYLNLNYTVEISKISEEDGGGYFISIPLLQGCMSDGESLEEAYANIEEAKQEWLQSMLKRNLPIPEPASDNQYSGKFIIRIPKSLHRNLAEESKREGISLNQFISNSLSYMIGMKHA